MKHSFEPWKEEERNSIDESIKNPAGEPISKCKRTLCSNILGVMEKERGGRKTATFYKEKRSQTPLKAQARVSSKMREMGMALVLLKKKIDRE